MKALVLFHSLHDGYTCDKDLTKPQVVTLNRKDKEGIYLTEESAKELGVYWRECIEDVFHNDEFTIIMELPND